MESLNKGNATEDEVVRLIELVLEAVGKVKEDLELQGKTQHSTAMSANLEVANDLENAKIRLQKLADDLDNTDYKLKGDLDKLTKNIYSELKRVEKLVPTLDFSPIEWRLDQIEGKIPKVPPQLTREQIRDSLEVLKGEERLDASAIKNLPKMIKETKGEKGGYAHAMGGRNIEVSGSVINLNIPVQPTAPENPVLNMLWIDNS